MAGIKVQQWDDKYAKKELGKRLSRSKKYREKYQESRWKDNEVTIFQEYSQSLNDIPGYGDINTAEHDQMDMGGSNSDMGINYAFKYHRFVLSQMSANPPSVIPVPTSSEYSDRRAAKVADHFIQHGRRKLKLQDKVDLTSLQTITYGTGFAKIYFDAYAGTAWEVDKKTGELIMEGEIRVKPLIIWNIYIDQDADSWEENRYIFERHFLSYEEAISRFPKHIDKIKELKGKRKQEDWQVDDEEMFEDTIEIYEYYEKALPWNGMDGRHCFLLNDGSLLTPIQPNPHVNATLPYKICTDVDVPGQVYGKTFIDYIVRLQDVLNKLDSTILDNVQAHGVARLVVFEGSEIPDDAENNDAWEIIQLAGSPVTAPMYINPPTLMPDLYKLREQILEGMESIAGTNESMFGQIKREMSGFSLQTAINAGNMVRRRLFNKYTAFVEAIYTDYLELIKKHYNDKKKILIVGEEDALSVAYYSNADLEGGYDLKVEYGASFSLDPASRREEIIQLIPHLKEGGYSMRQILGMLRLNEVGALIDMVDISKRRQIEIFDEMIARFEEEGTLIKIVPEKNEDHVNMLEAASGFRMGMVFKNLDVELQQAIDEHIDSRKEMAAELSTPTPQPGGAEAGGAAPLGALSPQPTQGIPQGVALPSGSL